MDLSIGKKVNVSGLSCVSNKVLRCLDSYKVRCDLIHHQNLRLCGVGLRGASLSRSR